VDGPAPAPTRGQALFLTALYMAVRFERRKNAQPC